MTKAKGKSQIHSAAEYSHQVWEGKRNILKALLKAAFKMFTRVDQVTGLENIPPQGAGILLINHIAFIDPLAVMVSLRRNIVPLAKVEVYDYPVIGIFPKLWGVIPVRREEVDRRAIQRALDVLRAGEIILVAPEGTRSPQLQEGKVGVAYLASRSGAPVIPVAIDSSEGLPTLPFSKRWWQPGLRIHFGRAFRYHRDYQQASRDDLRKMTDEAMYILASNLPEKRRGVYADLSLATQETVEWL